MLILAVATNILAVACRFACGEDTQIQPPGTVTQADAKMAVLQRRACLALREQVLDLG